MSETKLLDGREQAWVVKGKPHRNELTMMRAGELRRWVTRRPPKAWLAGDLVFLWESAPTLSVCGIAEIARIEFKKKHGITGFWLRYLTTYLGKPISAATLRASPTLRDASFLKSGPAGTVFPLSNSQATAIARHVDKANPALRLRKSKPAGSTKGLALSIRQPWAELIMRGMKVDEFRSFTTHKRGRIWIYASLGGGVREERERKRRGFRDLPTGVLVGSAEIVGVRQRDEKDFAWALRRPIRLKRPRAPKQHAQPSFFRPF